MVDSPALEVPLAMGTRRSLEVAQQDMEARAHGAAACFKMYREVAQPEAARICKDIHQCGRAGRPVSRVEGVPPEVPVEHLRATGRMGILAGHRAAAAEGRDAREGNGRLWAAAAADILHTRIRKASFLWAPA